jgi:hypothetical protein
MKVFLQYILMVGIPVIGVLGLLQVGGNLKAPVSVGGVWALNVAPQPAAGEVCEGVLVWAEPPALTISQSGPNLVLTFNDTDKTRLEGKVAGAALSGATRRTSGQLPGLQLSANIDRQVEPDRLQITLRMRGCTEPVSLVGIRQPRIQGAGGH